MVQVAAKDSRCLSLLVPRPKPSCYESPAGTTDNSPAIYRWDNGNQIHSSPAGAKECVGYTEHYLSSLTGLIPISIRNPPFKRWAIFFRPDGLGNGYECLHSKSRSTYSIPCFFKNTSISSLNVVL